ncbi:centromere protein R isoform X2 [Brachyhypopomus gauderio]
MPMSSMAKTQVTGNCVTRGRTVNSLETEEPLSETERLVFFRTKMEEYVETLMKTRQQLETLLPIEGNSELRSFLLMGPADLLAELKRHKELIAKLDRCVHAVPNPTSYLEGATQIGSSYEFLKKIFSD